MTQRESKPSTGTGTDNISRRSFIAGAGAAALSFTVMKPALVRGTEANSRIRIALLGCGGRGTWIAKLFKEHGGYDIVAAADYFRDRVDKFGAQIGVDPARRYTGLSGYRRLLDSGVDAIAVESPPYFHPEQAAAAVDAGVHVYLAKPIAVDVPGCKTIGQSGKDAKAKKLCFLVDFQTRAQKFFIEAIKRVHNGAIGEFAFGEATYHAQDPFVDHYQNWRMGPTNPRNRLRAWGLDRILSGDIINEQNIHTLDVTSWIMNKPPIQATGTGGRKVRTEVGDVYDNFVLVYEYPDKIGISFSSRQFDGHGTQPEGIRNRMFGSKGVLETEYGGQVIIRGENFYRGGSASDIYKEGAVNNIVTFYNDVTGGNYENPTVEPSVMSNLIAILGRTAAYEGRTVTWDELLRSDQKLVANLKGLKD